MKATGIVRRIDDLGRVVIPKEIRRTMRIKEGAPLEIYTSGDGEVIFKKYSAVNELSGDALHIAEVMSKLADCPVIIADRDRVIASAGVQKKEFSERRISTELEELAEQRKSYFYKNLADEALAPLENMSCKALASSPIISEGDVSGSVVFLNSSDEHTADDVQMKLVQAAAQILAKEVEG